MTKPTVEEKKAEETPVKAAPPKQDTQELSVSSGKQLEGIDEVSNLNKAQREKHSTEVREEGLGNIKDHQAQEKMQEIDLEIEAPGAANKVAEEGASVIPSEEEFHRLEK